MYKNLKKKLGMVKRAKITKKAAVQYCSNINSLLLVRLWRKPNAFYKCVSSLLCCNYNLLKLSVFLFHSGTWFLSRQKWMSSRGNNDSGRWRRCVRGGWTRRPRPCCCSSCTCWRSCRRCRREVSLAGSTRSCWRPWALTRRNTIPRETTSSVIDCNYLPWITLPSPAIPCGACASRWFVLKTRMQLMTEETRVQKGG